MLNSWKGNLLVSLFGGMKALKDNLVMPAIGRIGTSAATVLIGYGANAEQAQQVAVGIAAAGAIAFDLLIDWMNRKHAVRKATR